MIGIAKIAWIAKLLYKVQRPLAVNILQNKRLIWFLRFSSGSPTMPKLNARARKRETHPTQRNGCATGALRATLKAQAPAAGKGKKKTTPTAK